MSPMPAKWKTYFASAKIGEFGLELPDIAASSRQDPDFP